MAPPHLSGPAQEALPRDPPPPTHTANVQSLRVTLGPEVADTVAAACRATGMKFQAMRDRSSAFYLYKIARLFE